MMLTKYKSWLFSDPLLTICYFFCLSQESLIKALTVKTIYEMFTATLQPTWPLKAQTILQQK